MHIYFGGFGTDAGGYYWNGHKFVPVPGWGPEALSEVSAALKIMNQARQLKTPGLAEATAKVLSDFVQREFAAHVKEGGVLILGQ